MKWWERPVRMMRLDYISDLVRMKEADLDALARSKRDDWNINCEWVIGTPGIAPGLGHKVTFNTSKYEKYEALGDFDLIREYLPHARRYGIKVLAYLNMHWFSYEFAEEHPEWQQRLADGRAYGQVSPLYGGGTTFCVNTQWGEWSWDLIREVMKTGIDGVFLDGPVTFSGCCYCESCRKAFKAQYGTDIPEEEDWFDDRWKNFIEFRENSMAQYLSDSKKAMEDINPDGVIFLNAGSWHGGSWRVARNIEKVGDYQHFNGAESFFHPSNTTGTKAILEWALTAKHLMAGGKPAVVFSHHALGSWHYIPLPFIEAQLAVAQTVACGANPWIAIFDYALDHSREQAIAPIKEIQGFLAKNEEYYTSTLSEARVAVLFSSQSNTFYLSQLDDIYGDVVTGVERDLGVNLSSGTITRDWKKRKRVCDTIQGSEFYGWCVMLSRGHIPYDVILDKDLTSEGLAKYDVIVLPNSACLTDDQISALYAYVKDGGNLVASFETGSYDEKGNIREENALSDLLCISKIEGSMGTVVAEEYLKAKENFGCLRDGQFISKPLYSLKIVVGEKAAIPIKFLERIGKFYSAPKGESRYPGLVLSKYGEGNVAYLPYLLGTTYTNFKIEDHQALALATVKWSKNEDFEIFVDAPPTVQVELRSQNVEEDKKRLLLHFVNNTGDMKRPMSTIIPIYGIKVVLPGVDVKRIYTLWDKEELNFTRNESGIEFILPELNLYDVVVVE